MIHFIVIVIEKLLSAQFYCNFLIFVINVMGFLSIHIEASSYQLTSTEAVSVLPSVHPIG